MLGYCHNDKCLTDIWAPNDYGHVENRAFSGFAKHEQEKENIIKKIVNHYRMTGELQFSIDLSGYDDFSDSDLEYIQREVRKRLP
jgi:hypothetical protein